ncbi:23S rRNA (adenine(2030)-N(6))-methyltransferase RlmJ [Microbulbifer magnicolonia]|uniref:23S rRNA (adenine(2030)-N(6))-methyltransferase RlmJ n=1 Tax=Microbulbifer magnicolonia TaxID=3109744 RepID=UPI002B4005E8|nr:23S rRNA (adenine(2030)-N(6))-methyltransferase RlmJ [Microbulbifer sp. GG15]
MLSYRHAFHAGNHADVLKHLAEVLILDYLLQKGDKPLRYIDTHSGPGSYSLTSEFAQLNAEFETGIARLWQRRDLPAPLQRYVELVGEFNGERLQTYPGSPAFARALLKPRDRLQLFELHPDDAVRLERWGAGDKRVRVCREDGFKQLSAILPPAERRALVVIDPPYEVKQDYQRVISSLETALRRFATGVYLIWYPLLARPEVAAMVKKLKQMSPRHLHAELRVKDPVAGGMYGSGVFVVNPPWPLREQLQLSLPYLQNVLAQDTSATSLLTAQGLD